MKQAFYISIFLLSACSISLVSRADIASAETPNPTTILRRANQLNIILEQELRHLDEVKSILQYLGQALTKGTIPVSDKKEVRLWLQNYQEEIRKLEKACLSTTVHQGSLKTIILSTKCLMINTLKTINSSFEQLLPFMCEPLKDLPEIIDNPDFDTLETFSIMLEDNGTIIVNLKEQANRVGLSTINIVTRRIDAFNNKYSLLKRASYIPPCLLLGGISLHLLPHRYVATIPPLGSLKNWISGPEVLPNNSLAQEITTLQQNITNCTNDIERAVLQKALGKQRAALIHQNAHQEPQGMYQKTTTLLENAANNKAFNALLIIAGSLLMMKNSDVPGLAMLNDAFGSVKKMLSTQWNRLKGYALHDQNEYEVYEDITLDDERIVGIESQVDELRNLVRYIIEPDIYDRCNANLEKGILLTGPSRCGKTFAAKALAGTINKALTAKGITTKFGFKDVKWREVVFKKDGIKTIIEEARTNAPCVLFIDELHNLPLQTKEGGDVLTGFLTGMSGINSENDSRHQIILLAATNQPEKLDAALLESGRFGTKIHFERPLYESRKKYFEIMAKYNTIDISKLDLGSLVRQTKGCSYGDLETIFRNARFTARTLAKSLSQEHVQEKIDLHVHRLKNDIPLTKEEQKLIASHLAGHTLVYLLLDLHEKIELVTIKGKWSKIKETRFWEKNPHDLYKQLQSTYGKIFAYNDAEVTGATNELQKRNKCKMLLAGALAEEVLLGSTGYRYHAKDRQKVLNYALELGSHGMTQKDFLQLPKQVQDTLSGEAYKLVKHLELETKNLLVQNKSFLEMIAKELEEKTILRADDLQELLTAHLNKPKVA